MIARAVPALWRVNNEKSFLCHFIFYKENAYHICYDCFKKKMKATI